MTDTPFFDDKPSGALEAEDIAAAVMYALSQPGRVDVNEVLVRPVSQAG
jgi:NADP-dependent 3-hydroxy acid dehydrogenase YdfG